ncbi:hypothetical protein DsansV1_C14g0128501 [Dioscorea sansibarensis]
MTRLFLLTHSYRQHENHRHYTSKQDPPERELQLFMETFTGEDGETQNYEQEYAEPPLRYRAVVLFHDSRVDICKLIAS